MCSFCATVPQKSAKHASHSSSLSFWGTGRFKCTNPLNSAAQNMKEKTPFYFNLHTLAYLASQLGSPDAKAPAQRYPQAQTGKRAGQGCRALLPVPPSLLAQFLLAAQEPQGKPSLLFLGLQPGTPACSHLPQPLGHQGNKIF